MQELRIGTRLTLGFAVVVALAVGLLVIGLLTLGALGSDVDRMANYSQIKSKLLSRVERATLERAIAARNLVFLTEPAERQSQLDRIGVNKKEIDDSLQSLGALIQSNPTAPTGDVGGLQAAQDLEQRYWPIAKSIVDASNAGRKDEAITLLLRDCIPLLVEVKDGLAKFAQQNEAETESILAALDKAATQGRLWLAALGIAAVVLGSGLAWAIQRSVVGPLLFASHALERVAKGDLTQAIQAKGKDEIGQMLTNLHDMQSSLQSVIGNIRQGIDSINTSSSEIASGNQSLSVRTEQAASNLEETAASMEELTSTVSQSADAARQANQLAASASEVAVRGGQVVSQVVATMEEINHSSKKINDIIGVIDGIAFQTNILALNAAVEAARAGEQGRGFAVVAAEVRSLAQRSAEAAKEIKGLIGTSVDKVEAGTRLVADAGQTMSEIVGSVQRVSDIIGEITAASGEQSNGIAQVNTAVNQLDQMTQQNAALVEESAAAAESLKDQAMKLAQVVRVFRLGTTPEVSAARVLRPVASAAVAKPPPVAKVASGKARPEQSSARVATAPVMELKRPKLAAVQPAALAPVKVAAGDDEGDWESF